MMGIEKKFLKFHGRNLVKFDVDGPSIYICTVTPLKQMVLEGTMIQQVSENNKRGFPVGNCKDNQVIR